MTVAQNVEYGLKVKGVPRAERRRRTADALDMVRLTDHAPRRPAQLSGGQRQRVALARALVGRPRVLLLDEPLGALDLKLREQMQIELKAIQREVGITFIIVTHDQDEALTLCDRLAVFNDGRIEQVGNARDVYENPANRFVADFVGTSNVLDGAAAEALMGRPGMFVVRPERIGVFRAGHRSGARGAHGRGNGVRSHLRRPHHRIAAIAPPGVTLTATVLTASTCAAARPAPRHADHVGVARKSRPSIDNRGVAMISTARANRSCAGALRRAGRRVFEFRRSPAAPASHHRRWSRCQRSRQRRRPTQPHRLGRLRRGRLQRQDRRLGDPVRAEDRLQGQRQDRQHLRRDGAVDAHAASTTGCRPPAMPRCG